MTSIPDAIVYSMLLSKSVQVCHKCMGYDHCRTRVVDRVELAQSSLGVCCSALSKIPSSEGIESIFHLQMDAYIVVHVRWSHHFLHILGILSDFGTYKFGA
jgi:hypothetical protein